MAALADTCLSAAARILDILDQRLDRARSWQRPTYMHQYIIGATRSGKSNYLMTLAGSEEPFCFVDKHGTTARQIADSTPCVYWQPADFSFPIGLNPLQNVPHDERWWVVRIRARGRCR